MPSLDHALTSAGRAFESGEHEQVVDLLSAFLDTHPDDSRIPFAMGLAYGACGDALGASRMFTRAIRIEPEFHDARFNLAKSLKDQGQNSSAEHEYRQYLLSRPDDVAALYNLANIVAMNDRLDEAAELFRQVIRVAPHFYDGSTNLALIEDQRGNWLEALDLLEGVLAATPDHAHAHHLRRSILSKVVSHWHFMMLNDQDRNDAYEKAIAASVNGRRVLEIGAGSGLLSMMAARHGASSVVACEMFEPLAAAAEKIVARNGFADQISIVAKKSMQLEVGRDLPQRAETLIAEIFDVGLLGEGFVPALVHARAELLVDQPRLIPAGATVRGLLIECPGLKNIHPIGRISGFDLSDFNVFRKIGYEPMDMANVAYEAMCDPFVVSVLDFATLGLDTAETLLELPAIRHGTCHALVFWFDLNFDDGSTLSPSPDNSAAHWKQAVQFFDLAKSFRIGDVAKLKAVRNPNGYSFALM